MSDTIPREPLPALPDNLLAAEYVLRLLTPAEHRDAERRIERSGAFRAMVVRWQEDFVRLTDAIRDVPPPERLRGRLAEIVRSEAGDAVSGRGRRLSPLRVLAGAAGGLAVAGLVVALVLGAVPRSWTPDADAVYVADIAGEDPPFRVEARYDPAEGVLFLDRSGGAPGDGRVLQLWLLADGASAPVSLGVLPDETRMRLDLPSAVGASIPDGLLEISEEPEGGSPEAGPSGPVLGKGQVEEL